MSGFLMTSSLILCLSLRSSERRTLPSFKSSCDDCRIPERVREKAVEKVYFVSLRAKRGNPAFNNTMG